MNTQIVKKDNKQNKLDKFKKQKPPKTTPINQLIDLNPQSVNPAVKTTSPANTRLTSCKP